MVIQVGDSTAAVKQEISDLLEYVTGDGEITSWLNATNRINEVADLLGRDGIADGMAGATARARINALWDGPVWAPGATMALNWLDGRYFRGVPDLTRPTNATDYITGNLETYAPNVLRRADGHGALLEREGVNYVVNSDFSAGTTVDAEISEGDVSLLGVPATRVTRTITGVVNRGLVQVAAISNRVEGRAYTLWGIVKDQGWGVTLQNTAGLVVRLEVNGEITSTAYSSFAGSPRQEGKIELEDGFCLIWVTANAIEDGTGGSAWAYAGTTGDPVGAYSDFAHVQFEQSSHPSSIILTTGATASRAADLLTVPVQGGGRAFAYELDWLPTPSGTLFLLQWSNGEIDGAASQRINLHQQGTIFRIGAASEGPIESITIPGSNMVPPGRLVFYGNYSPEGIRAGLVGFGETELFPISEQDWSGIDRLGIANNSIHAASNTNIRARRFMEILNPPDPVAAFAQVRAVAEGWAA